MNEQDCRIWGCLNGEEFDLVDRSQSSNGWGHSAASGKRGFVLATDSECLQRNIGNNDGRVLNVPRFRPIDCRKVRAISQNMHMCYLCLIALFFVRQDPDSQVFLNQSIANGNNVVIAYHDIYVFMTHTVIDRPRKLRFDEQEEVVKRNLLLEAHKKATARQIKMKRLHLEPPYLRHDPRWCSRCKDHSLKAYLMPPVPNHSLRRIRCLR